MLSLTLILFISSGEKACDLTKDARKVIENCFSMHKVSNLQVRKLDLMVTHDKNVLCSAEWKSMASTKPVVMKQFVKTFVSTNAYFMN